jgi:hypothetical protein
VAGVLAAAVAISSVPMWADLAHWLARPSTKPIRRNPWRWAAGM